MRRKIPCFTLLAFTPALLSLTSSLQVSFQSDKVSLESGKVSLKSDKVSLESDKVSLESDNNPCLVCHTLHFRTCDSAAPAATQTFNSRTPRQASATMSMWPRKLQSLHLVSGVQVDPVSSECADEPGCGQGGRRTICKIRSHFSVVYYLLDGKPDEYSRISVMVYDHVTNYSQKRSCFSNPSKKICNYFWGGSEDFIFVQLILFIQTRVG